MKVSIQKCALGLILSAFPLFAESFSERAIGVSIGNEMVYAMEQAIDWTLARQGEDGAWGSGTNLYRTTTLLRAALLALRQPEATNACAKAGSRLSARPIPADQPLDAYAWHLLTEKDPATLAAIREAAKPRLAAAPPDERRIWRDAASAKGIPVDTPNGSPPATPPWPIAKTASCRAIWLAARTINRDFKGVIAGPDGEPVNWRRILAERLVSAQRRAGTGGYWPARDAGESDLTETAFALLTFLELL